MAKKSTTPAAPAAAPRPRRTAKPAAAAAPGNGNGGVTERKPTADEIAQAAYQRYLSRGGQHGSDFDDWIEAERELTSRNTR